MAILTILHYPDPQLHTRARPVAVVDDRIRQLLDDMAETMYANQGVGLAATQVNVHERVVVIDVSDEHNAPQAFINLEILSLFSKVAPCRLILSQFSRVAPLRSSGRSRRLIPSLLS